MTQNWSGLAAVRILSKPVIFIGDRPNSRNQLVDWWKNLRCSLNQVLKLTVTNALDECDRHTNVQQILADFLSRKYKSGLLCSPVPMAPVSVTIGACIVHLPCLIKPHFIPKQIMIFSNFLSGCTTIRPQTVIHRVLRIGKDLPTLANLDLTGTPKIRSISYSENLAYRVLITWHWKENE